MDHMPPFFDQSLLKCPQLARELANPQPGFAGGWLVGDFPAMEIFSTVAAEAME
jgi:hypothetical protein